MHTKVGTVHWLSIDRFGQTMATVAWYEETEPKVHLDCTLHRVTTPGI
jgi:hypothetical protein